MNVVPPAPPSVRWGPELAGLYTVLVEAGLQDLGGVSASVEGAPPSPAMRAAPRAAVPWQALLALEGDSEGQMHLRLTLCDQDGDCSESAQTGAVRQPQTWLPGLLAKVAARLGAPPASGAPAAWAAPLSSDDYAILLTGRSAAVHYGLLARTPGSDPVARAVKVDPAIAQAQWLQGRARVDANDPIAARQHFSAAATVRPSSPALRADQAVMLSMLDRPQAAHTAWEALHTRQPADPRWGLAAARAALDAGALDRAEELGVALDAGFPRDAEVARLRVRVLEQVGDQPDYDTRLADWAARDARNPEPIRRRVLLAVREQRYAEAWQHLDQLQAIDAASANRLRVPVGIALGHTESAATAAESFDATLAADIRQGSAPGPDQQRQGIDTLRNANAAASELGIAAMNAQNQLAEARATGADRCAGTPDAATRLLASLDTWRRALEDARAQRATLATLQAHPSLLALDDARAAHSASTLGAALDRGLLDYRSTLMWTTRHLGTGCRSQSTR